MIILGSSLYRPTLCGSGGARGHGVHPPLASGAAFMYPLILLCIISPLSTHPIVRTEVECTQSNPPPLDPGTVGFGFSGLSPMVD
eukprot:scaffold8658_cov157-Isochrysis_galbana.AAC.1